MAYDKNTDYQAMINDAVAKGDYTSAAVFEQQRNEKIKGEGITDYQTTNNYSQYLNGGVSQAQNPENDYSDYLKELYAQQMEAELSALKSQYDKNAAGLKADAEKIPVLYQAARNETAAQNDIQRQAFNEFAVANGLNTGTSGQAALANSAVLQGNLAQISGQESDALAENALAQQQLAIDYENAVAQARASGNASLAQALYQEMVRQQQAADDAAAAAQAQANWEKEFAFTQQQYGDSRSDAAKDAAYNLAMTMLTAGVMPDSSTLSSAGISAADANAIRNAALREMGGYGTGGSGTSGSTGSGSSGSGSSGSSGSSASSGGSYQGSSGTGASSPYSDAAIKAQVSEYMRRNDIRGKTAQQIVQEMRNMGYIDAVIDAVLANIGM